MYLELLLCAGYSAVCYYTSSSGTITFSSMFAGWVLTTMLCTVIVYIAGIILFKYNVESEVGWNFFSGFGYSYEADSVKSYLLSNLPRLIFLLVFLGVIYMTTCHSI